MRAATRRLADILRTSETREHLAQNACRLYGSQARCYTGRVRACLRWENIPHTGLVSDAKAQDELIIRRSGFRAIAVIVSPADETLQDSTDIIYIFVRH
jgi:hypothetical protein